MNNQQEKTLLPQALRLHLKKMAHHLKPVIQVGKKGVTEALIQEIDQALLAHELIKIQMSPKQKDECESLIAQIMTETQASHIDTIGNIVILFRKREEDSSF